MIKRIIVFLSIGVFCLGIFGGLVSLYEISKIKDDLVRIEYEMNKPNRNIKMQNQQSQSSSSSQQSCTVNERGLPL